MNTPPVEMMEKLNDALNEAWQSPGGMCVDTQPCDVCKGHWHIMVCPAVRELMGGQYDGKQVYARFGLNVNKLMRAFDKRPKTLFDNALGHSVPHVILYGRIAGVKCDVSVMSCPPSNMDPLERVYTDGPKKGEVERLPYTSFDITPDEHEDDEG